MSEVNPYEPPELPRERKPLRRFENPRDKWFGLLCALVGILMLAYQTLIYFISGVLSAWLLGGGVGILGVGVFRLIAYYQDKRYSQIVEQEYSRQEYESRYE